MLIGTHNSGTGEASKGLLSCLIAPFAKCQSKTIQQQYDAGCRYFDLRVTFIGDKLYLAHGLWKSKTSLEEALEVLNKYNDVYVSITYEHNIDNIDIYKLYIDNIYNIYNNIKYTYIAIKNPKWTVIESINSISTIQGFKSLDGSSWHTYIPIPWFWDRVLSRPHKFNNEIFTLVDFL